MVTHNFPRFTGDPAGAFVARLAEAAAGRGHEVHAIAPHTPGLPTHAIERGVHVERCRYAPDSLERVAYRGDLHRAGRTHPLVMLGVPLLFAAMRRATRRTVRALPADVVHAHWWIPGGVVAHGSGAPVIITCHGSDVRVLERSAIARRIARRVLGAASAVTAVSRFLAADLERFVPSLHGRVRVTPMPVDAARFERGALVPKADPPQILYAGNLLRTKGVHVLLRAAAILRDRGLRFRVRILGEGPMRAELDALARELRLGGLVDWSPFVPQHSMPDEYGASTIVVLPSLGSEEGLGLTLVEALLAGAAVIGTPAGGIPEVVEHERTGLIARDGDAVDLADRIAQLLGDAPLRARLTAAGAEHARRTFAADASADRFLALYDEVRR